MVDELMDDSCGQDAGIHRVPKRIELLPPSTGDSVITRCNVLVKAWHPCFFSLSHGAKAIIFGQAIKLRAPGSSPAPPSPSKSINRNFFWSLLSHVVAQVSVRKSMLRSCRTNIFFGVRICKGFANACCDQANFRVGALCFGVQGRTRSWFQD